MHGDRFQISLEFYDNFSELIRFYSHSKARENTWFSNVFSGYRRDLFLRRLLEFQLKFGNKLKNSRNLKFTWLLLTDLLLIQYNIFSAL